MKKSSKDLTTGSITKNLLLFALPIFLGQLFQNLYHSVDSIVVGQALGKTALAAVSASSDISMLLIGFFMGLSTGAGIVFSRYFGAKDNENLHTAIHTAVTFSLWIGFVIAALGFAFTPQLLRLVKCPADVFPEAQVYLRIYLIGLLFTAFYNVGSGVLRAVGDSQTPFNYLVISSCVNIVLDVVLVVFIPWGVAGAALATIFSQLISVVLVVRKMLITEDVYKLVPKDLGINGSMLGEILKLGLPAAVQTCLIGLSNLFVQRYINSFGSAAMAGIGAAKRVERFVGMVAQCLGMALATFVSQNYGAKKLHRAFHGIRIALGVGFLYLLVFGALGFIFAKPLVQIFITDPESVEFGVAMLRVMLPFFFASTANSIFSNAVQGFGKAFVVMCCGVLGMVACRQIFLAIALNINYDIHILYFGYPFGWVCAALGCMVYYFFAIRRKYPEEARWRKGLDEA